MVFSIISAAVAVVALALSFWSLYRQRPVARIEAHPVTQLPQGIVNVQVLNAGNRPARAPWFVIVVGGYHVIGSGGAFLGPGKQAMVRTSLASTEKLGRRNVSGIVGHIDPDGRFIARHLWGGRFLKGRKRKFKAGNSYQDIFTAMEPGVDFGEKADCLPGERVE